MKQFFKEEFLISLKMAPATWDSIFVLALFCLFSIAKPNSAYKTTSTHIKTANAN